MDFLGASVLMLLLRACLQGGAVVAGVWLVCHLMPRLPASLRCTLWWLACAKFALGLVWTSPVRLELLPVREPEPAVASPFLLSSSSSGSSGGVEETNIQGMRRLGDGFWADAILASWGIGVLIFLGSTLAQLRQARQLIQRARPVDEPWLAELFVALRQRTGAPERTEMRLSSEIETPQVSGLVHPVVLLPESASSRLSRPELAMTLCHELLHVRRGDLWLGWVAVLAQRLFFFHPLAHVAAREYVLAREAACDADVLRVLDPAPETYGHLLVRLGVSPRPPKLAAAGAAPSYRILKRRLIMLQNATNKKRVHPAWWTLVALSAVVLLVPFIITAQEPGGGGEAYVLLLGQETSVMGGSPPAFEEARKLQRSDDDQLFWFRHDQRNYVIRDTATLDQIRELFEPQMRLGNKMAQLSDHNTSRISAAPEANDHEKEKEVTRVYVYEEESDRGERGQTAEADHRHEALGRQQEVAIRNAEEQLRVLISEAISNGAAQEVR